MAVGVACGDPEAIDVSMQPPISATSAPTNGLIGEWKLDESGGTTAADTKNGFDAGLHGQATFIGTHLGNFLKFDNGTTGTGGNYAEMPSNTTLDGVQESNYSISAWFYPLTKPSNTDVNNRSWAIVVKAGHHIGLVFESDQRFAMRHYIIGDTLESVSSAQTYALNTWHHVVGTVNKTTGTIKVYVDNGTPTSTSFTANRPSSDYGTKPFRIGIAQTTWAANGRVDQVRIYNRELTATDVSNLFNETVTTPPTVTTNAATGVAATGATFRGSANPNGTSATGWFRYATTNPGTCNDTFGARSPATGGTALGAGSGAVAYSRVVSGLTASTTYYFCALASNAGGTGVGVVRSFMTTSVASGIPFGLFGIEPDSLPNNTKWTAGVHPSKNISNLLGKLAAARSKTPRLHMWYNITGGNEQDFADMNGNFSLEHWKDTLRKYALPLNPDGTAHFSGDLVGYIEDGTLQGIVMLDDIAAFATLPTFADLEGMAEYAKELYPGITTAVRALPSVLEGLSSGEPYQQLDVAWGQYRESRGNVSAYRDNEIASAKRLDLGLVLGINIDDGANPFPTTVTPSQLLVWGSALLAPTSSDFACGFLMYSTKYPSLGSANMDSLASKALAHVAAPCKRRP